MAASLTQISITTRKVIRWGIFFAIFLIAGKVLLDIGITAYRKAFPPPPPPPTVSFGKLPKLPFPDQQKISLTYLLETPEGGLPKLPTQAKVYFMPKSSAGLLSLDSAKITAKNLGFDTNAEQVSQTVYKFKNKDVPSTLQIDIVTGAFSVSYDLASDPSPLSVRPPTPEVAAAGVRSYLSSANLFPPDLTGQATFEFLKPQGGKLVSALSLSDSNIIKVNFFRKNYGDIPPVTPDPNQGNVWFYVSGLREPSRQNVAAQYGYFAVDESKFATYPLKTSDTSWKELTSGNAYIASLGENKEGDSITIRRVFLAYYDAGVPTQFYQPLAVFEGDKDFVAYVPAVTSDYFGE